MLEEAEIAGQFQMLLDLEQQAEQLYAQMVQQNLDPHVRRQIQQLQREKQRHIALTRRLLEIVEA